jgi:hypothetical protein
LNPRIKIEEKTTTNENIEMALFDRSMRIQDIFNKKMSSDLGDNYTLTQVFIPAGRALYTSVGKIFAAFEQGGIFDPLTIRFGTLFNTLKENYNRRLFSRTLKDDLAKYARNNAIAQSFFGGQIKIERSGEFIDHADGRQIPFAYLSSGQQELLPLWIVLDRFKDAPHSIIYIEEPEAHLFPTAQSQIVEFLVGIFSRKDRRRVFLTTHSPYVISKMNVLIKAGSIGFSTKKNEGHVAAVIDKDAWLRKEDVAIYALLEGKLKSIIDTSGMIDSDYLDGVSNDITDDFSRLLDIEFPQ